MKKYLVTGGGGFIGSNIVKKIIERGDFARVLDNFSTGRKRNLCEFEDNPNFELIEGDITDFETCKTAVRGMDFILHQAAMASVPRSIEEPILTNNANVLGTLNMLVAARDGKVKKFVYASSSSVYGDNPELPKKENFPVMPISPYALQKYAGERYCQVFWKIYGLPTVCLRYFNVFGPKQDPNSQYSAVIPKFITAFIEGRRPVVFGDGNQSRDFTFVDNVVQANLLAAESEDTANGEVFNAACQGETSLNELIESLKRMSGKEIAPEHESPRAGDVIHSKADISKFKNIVGFNPSVDFDEGLEKTFEWYKNQE